MKAKSMIAGCSALVSCILMASGAPQVSAVEMSQETLGRLVTIKYKLSSTPAVVTLDVETNATDGTWASIGGAPVSNARGSVWRKVESSEADENGFYTITWRPDLSWEGHKIAEGGARAKVTAWALDNTPDYMVVDLSDGAATGSQEYYTSADHLPGGILANTEYRTTKLLMRKIMAKDVKWTMGSTPIETQRSEDLEATHPVMLTNNFYIGVFPVTQTQWAIVATNSNTKASFSNVDYMMMRPMENVSYNEIRMNGDSYSVNMYAKEWPNPPYSRSVLGLLNLRTGLDFDLPSEAQWEFAARAGNGAGKWGDGTSVRSANPDANLAKLARYKFNGGMIGETSNVEPTPYDKCGPQNGTAIVGSYEKNSWGLYDVHGNVFEWCLDWRVNDISDLDGAVNTNKPTANINKVARGGAWNGESRLCRAAFRHAFDPVTRSAIIGFRVACTAGLK